MRLSKGIRRTFIAVALVVATFAVAWIVITRNRGLTTKASPQEIEVVRRVLETADAVRVTGLTGTTRSAADYARFHTIEKREANYSFIVEEILTAMRTGDKSETSGNQDWILTFIHSDGSTVLVVEVQFEGILIGNYSYSYGRHMYLADALDPDESPKK
jgi:hypothetical protein